MGPFSSKYIFKKIKNKYSLKKKCTQIFVIALLTRAGKQKHLLSKDEQVHSRI